MSDSSYVRLKLCRLRLRLSPRLRLHRSCAPHPTRAPDLNTSNGHSRDVRAPTICGPTALGLAGRSPAGLFSWTTTLELISVSTSLPLSQTRFRVFSRLLCCWIAMCRTQHMQGMRGLGAVPLERRYGLVLYIGTVFGHEIYMIHKWKQES